MREGETEKDGWTTGRKGWGKKDVEMWKEKNESESLIAFLGERISREDRGEELDNDLDELRKETHISFLDPSFSLSLLKKGQLSSTISCPFRVHPFFLFCRPFCHLFVQVHSSYFSTTFTRSLFRRYNYESSQCFPLSTQLERKLYYSCNVYLQASFSNV